ncbi:energy-coupling factor transporter transmembrane protein EcfT [Desemzia sp. RIT804]|uniref:energy-coupling factor transporter transmembrane component T family protein n=1 Tax=Desemzia sp. RIT 804 TaxID=2810209 RepID=UPI00195243FB|nr:energy-coupling factor transporter transmembrane component T [Desemzia sp. RIT 804]MBM6615236.1 energy-coupling factor transporter transmembrane protein EcfT [Desemzia sp. RIT 804]
MSDQQLLGYTPNETVLHQLSGAAKLICFMLLSAIVMVGYDTRFLLFITLFAIFLFKISEIRWHQISFVVKFIAIFSVLNLITVYLFEPEYGVQLYGTRHVIWDGIGRYNLTQEQLFYEANLVLKYMATIPLALIFILTTNPSEFAASLNKIGVPYKISYSVSLALRYIPDVQESFHQIGYAQQARGLEMSSKGKLGARIKGTAGIVMPLIFSSLDRIDTITNAMELRRFGTRKNRTWYAEKKFRRMDHFAIFLVTAITLIGTWLFAVNEGRFYNPFE